MNANESTNVLGSALQLRSGVVARLAGISPSTLRIWEHRYGVVLPPKSASGHRAYSMKDVERLRIIKRLTSEGHSISSVALLDLDALNALSSIPHDQELATQKVLVVGNTVARKLERWFKLDPKLVFDNFEDAEHEAGSIGQVDVIVIHTRTMHPQLAERILLLRKSLFAKKIIVTYSFGPEAVSDSLLMAGVIVRRAPLSSNELLSLIFTAAKANEKKIGYGTQLVVRRFSDTDLVTLAEIPTMVSCECVRHLSEIVTLLTEFETYSNECASLNLRDVSLHRNLLELTCQARSTMETALDRVVIEENLSHLISR